MHQYAIAGLLHPLATTVPVPDCRGPSLWGKILSGTQKSGGGLGRRWGGMHLGGRPRRPWHPKIHRFLKWHPKIQSNILSGTHGIRYSQARRPPEVSWAAPDRGPNTWHTIPVMPLMARVSDLRRTWDSRNLLYLVKIRLEAIYVITNTKNKFSEKIMVGN